MNITLIYGGRSGEHEISLISASAILRGIDKKHTINLIGITKSGKWYLQSQDEVKRVCNDSTATLQITEDASSMVNIIPGGHTECFCVNGEPIITDVVFPALHGTYGEDGKIQGLLEMAEIAFVGCSTMASSLTMDKEKTKQVLEACGISVVPYICMKRCDMLNSNRYDQLFNKAIETLGFPLFVKPCCAGSSNGASKAENPRQLSFALMEAFSWDDKVLIEKAIDAREIECSVTGNSVSYPSDSETEIVKAYLPGEILPTHTFYDYDAKYKDPNGAGLQIPADLSPDMIETIRSEAVKIYKALDAEGLSRVDFFIDKETNDLYFNEINTMPGFTSISMFPKMCEKTGLNFTNLLELLITQALERFLSKSTLQTSR
ncbi:MAG: D-alanine--D-alanine ligase [Treponema sp.]|nr:D-alanine--D-alanine ligase [Treponema sp.]